VFESCGYVRGSAGTVRGRPAAFRTRQGETAKTRYVAGNDTRTYPHNPASPLWLDWPFAPLMELKMPDISRDR